MDSALASSALTIPGLSVAWRRDYRVASLRYFDARGDFAAGLERILGAPLPRALGAVRGAGEAPLGELILAWRSPTETLLLATGGAPLEALDAYAEGAAEGCIVDQSGGYSVWQLSGARSRALIERIGSIDSLPGVGEARVGRLAELPVMSLSIHEGEILLVVERLYSEHLLGWIRATAADL